MGQIILVTHCPRCEKENRIAVSIDEYIEYTQSRTVPHRLSLSDREALISGFCDECWDELFKEM